MNKEAQPPIKVTPGTEYNVEEGCSSPECQEPFKTS